MDDKEPLAFDDPWSDSDAIVGGCSPVHLTPQVPGSPDLAVLAQDLGEMRGICWVRGQFLLLSDPGKTPLPVRIARNLRHSRVSLANGAKFAQFASNSFYLSAKD